mgnify:CR=1 FL=1
MEKCFRILAKEQLSPSVFKMEVEDYFVAQKALPGQFLILRINEEGERIPLTIYKAHPQKQSFEIVFLVVGKTTKVLSQLNKDDCIKDILGPLGRPSEIPRNKTLVFLGGGVGIAEILPLAKAAKEAGNKIVIIAGFRSQEYVILEEEMRTLSDSLFITTDDGSYGRRGFNTEVLKEILSEEKIDLVYTCGPVLMMQKAAEITKTLGVGCIASLNALMVDGTGMCGSCRVLVGGKVKLCCVDGPDFDAHQVDFSDLINRQNRFREEEKRVYG